MHMHTTEVKSEPEDAEDHSLFTSRIRRRDADSDADSGKNTDTETFLDIQEFVTQFFPFRNHYSEEKEQMNKHIRGEKEEPMKDRIWDVRLPFAPSSIKRVSDTSDNQKVYKNSSEKLLKMTEIRKVVDSPDARLPCESTPNTSVPIIDISDDKEYQNTPKENQPSHDSTEKLLKVTEIRKEIIDSPDTGDFTQSSCMNDPASNDYKFGEEHNSSFMRIQQLSGRKKENQKGGSEGKKMKHMSHRKKVKYMRKFGLANSAERRKRQQEKRKEYMEYQRLMAFANSSKGRETKEKTKEDFTPSLCMNDPVADIVSESEVQYICSLGRNKQNSSESTLMKQISEEREKKKKPFSCMKDLRELEECFLESQDIFENNLRVIEAKAAEKRSEKKSILCEKCNKDVTRGRKLLCEEPGNCICKESNQDVGSCKRKETGSKGLLQEPEPNRDVDSCKRKKTRGRKAVLKEPEPNQDVGSCERKKTRGRKAVLKEPESCETKKTRGRKRLLKEPELDPDVDSCKRKNTRGRKGLLKEPEPDQDVDSCKRKKTTGTKGLLIEPDSVQDEIRVRTLDETEERNRIKSLNKSDVEFFNKTCSFIDVANKFISNHSLCDDIYERELKSRTFLEEEHMMLGGKTDVRKLKFPETNLFEGYPYLSEYEDKSTEGDASN